MGDRVELRIKRVPDLHNTSINKCSVHIFVQCVEKRPSITLHFYFLNKSVKYQLILLTDGTEHPEET